MVLLGDGLGIHIHPQKDEPVIPRFGQDSLFHLGMTPKKGPFWAIESSRSIEKLFLFLWDADPEINTISVSGLETTNLVGCLLQSPMMQLYFLSGV